MIRAGLTIFLLSIALLISSKSVEASHTDYVVEDPSNNPNGTSNPWLFGVQRAWVVNGQPVSICSGWGSSYSSIPMGIQQAIFDWEGVLSSTQLDQNCSAQSQKLWIRPRSASASWPCESGAWGCAFQSLSYDASRRAYFPTLGEIYVDDINFSYTDAGWQYMGAHELGHIFGLDETYVEAGINSTCNLTGPPSVMNLGTRTASYVVTGACSNGSLSPTQRDIDMVFAFYYGEAPDQFNLTLVTPDTVTVDFFDREWAESGYRFYVYRQQSGGGWGSAVDNFVTTNFVGSKDHWISVSYIKPGSLQNGVYRFCVSATTGIYGATGYQCSSEIHFADHDPAATNLILVGPASINLSAADPRAQWALGEIENQGDHGEYFDLSLTIESDFPAGCFLQSVLILPGSETAYFLAGEHRLAVYRVYYECHAPAAPGFPVETVTLVVSHDGGGEPVISQGNNTKFVNKTLIIQ